MRVRGASLDAWALLDGVAVGVVVHDVEGRILYANGAASTLLGIHNDTLVTRSSHDGWDILGENGEPILPGDQPAMRALATGEPVRDVLLAVARPSADRVWLLVTAIPSGSGADRYVVVTFTDATAQHARLEQAQSARVLSELHHEAVLRAMSEGVVYHDPSGAIRFSNPAAWRILGLSREQLHGVDAVDPRWRLIRSDGSPLPGSEIPSEVTTRTGVAVRNMILGVERGDAARAWLSVSSDCVAGEGDSSRGVVATFTDITALREAQLEQDRIGATLRAVTEAAPGVIFQYEIDTAGAERFAFVAGRTLELFGITDSDTRDVAVVRARIHPDDQPRFAAEVTRCRESLAPLDQEVQLFDGARWRWVRIVATVTRAEKVTIFTGFAFDATEQHSLAEGLRRAQLRHAVGDIAAGVAHNFNNMLAVILPNIEEALARFPDAQPFLADAVAATKRAAELVKQILYIAQGTDPASRENVDLARVVGDVVELCRRTFDRSIQIETTSGPEPALTLGSETHLQQVVLNLCLNARDALEGRSAPKIELRLDSVDAPLGKAAAHHRLTVRDNGEGMTEETRLRLGELFFTTKPRGRGTGLGLATLFGTMRDIDGTVVVESEPGKGTTFVLRFPAAEARAPSPARRASVRPSRLLGVLLVEDEELVLRATSRILSRAGHVVHVARSGLEALDILEREPRVDVVLLDLSMPGISGRETLRRIRERPSAPPVVVLSGNSSERAGLEVAAEIVDKPAAAADLLAAIDRAVAADEPEPRPVSASDRSDR